MSASMVWVVTATGVIRAVCGSSEQARAVARQCEGRVQQWPVLDESTLPRS